MGKKDPHDHDPGSWRRHWHELIKLLSATNQPFRLVGCHPKAIPGRERNTRRGSDGERSRSATVMVVIDHDSIHDRGLLGWSRRSRSTGFRDHDRPDYAQAHCRAMPPPVHRVVGATLGCHAIRSFFALKVEVLPAELFARTSYGKPDSSVKYSSIAICRFGAERSGFTASGLLPGGRDNLRIW
jgi:hypothetical protein